MSRSLTAVIAVLAGLAWPALGLGQSFPMTIPSDPESRAISVVVDPGITKTAQLRRADLRETRKAMHEGLPVADDALRALADARDGLAAARYADRLIAEDPLGRASDIAWYTSIAVGSGRVYALRKMVTALHRLDPADEPAARKRQYMAVLYPHAWAGNALAMDAVIAFNGEGRLFGALSDATRDKILDYAAGGDGRVELRFAVRILADDDATAADLARARSYLERARASVSPTAKATAETLLSLLDARTGGAPTQG
ncbi:hypothetical protein DXV76_08305 [Rhodobacteraceae bacterium CCMM004]|nr:hypothetical protein DXV76_08305 [Rhodobacteraceae bacterium CCMM004]